MSGNSSSPKRTLSKIRLHVSCTGSPRAVERPRREDEAVLVDVRLRDAEAGRDDAAHVQLVRLHVHEADELAGVEDRPHEQEVVDVRAVPVRVVGDDHVARLEALGAVLLDRVPDRVGHRPREEDDARCSSRASASLRRGGPVMVAAKS